MNVSVFVELPSHRHHAVLFGSLPVLSIGRTLKFKPETVTEPSWPSVLRSYHWHHFGTALGIVSTLSLFQRLGRVPKRSFESLRGVRIEPGLFRSNFTYMLVVRGERTKHSLSTNCFACVLTERTVIFLGLILLASKTKQGGVRGPPRKKIFILRWLQPHFLNSECSESGMTRNRKMVKTSPLHFDLSSMQKKRLQVKHQISES